ncbi:sulfatase-like hydrolase/transferase [Bradyrhizobium liaoningense]|uniref:sulfatase-like hydrolase/transferase n=1 Tax=Bradyrhizobium liaoningense TaxID=43992 RepID=UPI001BAD2111|nr:sulfatase-like hydrolase/transferase [Bradyrhizobium liaoningense]MBR0817177.1 sulfatase-like hydrolase/transferase [Bradyrhizobium liaoningense]
MPNLVSLATMTSLVDIGLPPRSVAIALYASIAILARRIPFILTVTLFLAALSFDVVQTLSLMFGLAVSDLTAAVDHAKRINFFASPLYLALIATLVITTVATLACLRSRTTLVKANIPVLFFLAQAFGVLDYVSNASPHYHFGSTMGRNEPVHSAAEVSGFRQAAGIEGNNVVLVIVEGLGYLQDQNARARIAEPLYDQSLRRDYIVTSGKTVYFGSTTSGEMRELCNTRTFYTEYVQSDTGACLPDLLAAQGYRNIAVHGFAGGMFERERWYPTIGFDQELFREELVKTTHRVCGSAFAGACDADLAPVISAVSREAGKQGKPRFIYWLTLNTHIPVAPGQALTDFHCGIDGGAFGRPKVCRMAELWHDVFAVVAKIARDPAVAPADILVVGDHAPPFWSRHDRAQFEPGQVAWYRLQPRREPPMPMREAPNQQRASANDAQVQASSSPND